MSAKDRATRLVIGYWFLILATAVFVYVATQPPNDGLAGMWLELVTIPGSLALAGNGLVGTDAILALAVVGFLQGLLAYLAFILWLRASKRPRISAVIARSMGSMPHIREPA